MERPRPRRDARGPLRLGHRPQCGVRAGAHGLHLHHGPRVHPAARHVPQVSERQHDILIFNFDMYLKGAGGTHARYYVFFFLIFFMRNQLVLAQ